MKRISLIILISISIIYQNFGIIQNENGYDLFLKFAKLYNSGDLVNAEKCMLLLLDSKESISKEYLIAAYNNLGATNSLLEKYNEALGYYNLAENQIADKEHISLSLAEIYINKAIIYDFQRSFTLAIEYYEKGIRIFESINHPDKRIFQSISAAYLNVGITYYKTNDYQKATEYLEKSADLKLHNKLSGIAITYLNIAKTYSKKGEIQGAEKFYKKSIFNFITEYGENYYRLGELYLDYGSFLESERRFPEALEIFNKALSICIKNYGEKHSLVALSYKHLGDYFKNQKDYHSALIYYQKALIAYVNDFNDPDVYSNPSITSLILDIRLLDNLKSKSQVLELLAMRQEETELKLKSMKKSFETIELALQLISKIRNDYMTEESRIYLADNEKETYIYATYITQNMYTLTGDPDYLQKMYNITKQAKAGVLRNEIVNNELLYSIGIPDTLQKKHKDFLVNIAAYGNLIQEEKRKANPDNNKIDFWKDAIFGMKRMNEKLEDDINEQFPQYRVLLQKTEPASLEEIQNNLGKDETLVEYFLSNQYTDCIRKLYIFLVTKDKLNFLVTDLDSIFIKDVERIREGTVHVQLRTDPLDSYRNYTIALFNMYKKLIKPIEDLITGNKLIIIPDEEIAYLPFDAFINRYPDSAQINYEGLQYLIYNYTFSYGYSSSLFFHKEKNMTKKEKVYAFSPDYRNYTDDSGKNSNYLAGAAKEIGTIYLRFPGKKYLGKQATETNFKSVIKHTGILHLAMHSIPDPYNSKYSCLLFDTRTDTVEDGKLFNYEIGLSKIKSSMVVLSACNTGTGTLSHGEGIMSLARGFILAGALSVVKTFWDVNDEVSAAIISRFYFHLSKGEKKDEALRLAKLEYLKAQSPEYTNPYYWAAYEVLGDNAPITQNNVTRVLSIIVILILLAIVSRIYFRRRSILSARSR